MKDYEIILWCINAERNAPLGVGHYYPLMLRIIINKGYINKDYMKDSALTFFDYVISETYTKYNMFRFNEYYKQTIKVLETFNKIYEEDKDKAMNMKTEDFIKMVNKGEI